MLQNAFTSYPQYREILRMIMSTVGRGGEGDVGQRIRDEILVIQVHIYFHLLAVPFSDRGEGIFYFPLVKSTLIRVLFLISEEK